MKALNAPGVLSSLLAKLRIGDLYHGIYGDGQRVVMVDKRRLSPEPSQLVWNHSPDGFNWGYGGSGPAQLALALLLDAGLPKSLAVQLHQAFKWMFVATWPQQANWMMEGASFRAWITQALTVAAESELAEQDAEDVAGEDLDGAKGGRHET